MGEAMAMTMPGTANGSAGTARLEVAPLERAQWETAVHEFRDYNYRQVWAYGVALAARRGAASEHVAILRDGELLGLADVRVKSLPVIGGGLAYVSGGPLVRRGEDGDALERLDHCLDALAGEYVRRRGLTLRVGAPVGPPDHNEAVADHCLAAGWRTADAGRYRTVLLDIDREPDAIQASLHKNWRQSIRRAARKGVTVTFGTELDRFDAFAGMLAALRARKGFDVELDERFFAAVQAEAPERDRLVVGLAFVDGAPVAGNVTAIHGDTGVYLLGASTDAGLEAQASYLLHWQTIERLRERGAAWYDLGGIDPEANPGVAAFKIRTNGMDVTAAGPFDLAPDGLRGRVTTWAERAYVRAKGAR
jgi:hypothetical protein